MAFKKPNSQLTAPDSPEKVLLELPRRKIPSVLLHQGEIMMAYAGKAVSEPDVALQLPTGSGKTLVGLMIAEWRRRKFQERIVYLCPTRQLVNQVVEQASDKYGLSVNGFIGSASGYSSIAMAEYQSADKIAVTTYNSLFNVKPYFDSPDIVIVDDAHTAENYIASLWTVRVERDNVSHFALHAALGGVLKQFISSSNYARFIGNWSSYEDRAWVDKISSPDLMQVKDEICAIFDAHVIGLDLRFSWSMIRDHLHACHLYISSHEIMLRPLIPPTWTHAPFANAHQRIFMSATLGSGGDLERLTGRRKILRLPVAEGWDRQGIGRRYFVFPGMSLSEVNAVKFRLDVMRRCGRSLVLVPDDKLRMEIAQNVSAVLTFPIFSADQIETSKTNFISSPNAVAVIANRYDGIDFPGDDCRVLFIEGLPKASNLQERFLMTRMGAGVLLNERVQTRVLQAIGRCTRSLEDFSVVVVSGEELPGYLADRRRRVFLHPELQAELEFGVEQSKDQTIAGLLDNVDIFLRNDHDWEEANKQILAIRQASNQQEFPALDDLGRVVSHEIDFQSHLWQGDFESALGDAESVLGILSVPELRGYRALWHYLAGSAAWIGYEHGDECLSRKARVHFGQAKEAAQGIPWLVTLARFQPHHEELVKDNIALMHQIERIEIVLSRLGTLHDRAYTQREKEILDGLLGNAGFEQAQVKLGEMLGFDVGKEESDGSPDPWWIAEDICLVFEDHADADIGSTLSVKKARQAASHPNWMRLNVPAVKDSQILPVLVTPVTKASQGAIPQLNGVALWSLSEFRGWAKDALITIRELRRNFTEPGDLVWRAHASEAFEREGLDAPGLFHRLQAKSAATGLNEMK
jgi:hypothetical protein